MHNARKDFLKAKDNDFWKYLLRNIVKDCMLYIKYYNMVVHCVFISAQACTKSSHIIGVNLHYYVLYPHEMMIVVIAYV